MEILKVIALLCAIVSCLMSTDDNDWYAAVWAGIAALWIIQAMMP